MSGTVRVLYVDDDPDFSAVTAEVLEREHDRFEVTAVTDAEEGLDELEAGAFDCVVSDYDMPATDGLEFLAAVRERYPSLPFLLFTGEGNEDVASEAIAAGATDYLQKRIGTDQYDLLANRVRNAVEQYRTEREREQTIERVTDAVIKLDSEWAIRYADEQAQHLFGMDSSELRGRSVWDLFPESRDTRFEAAYRRVMETREPASFEAESSVVGRWFQVEAYPDDDGGISAYLRDVTDRKERERELERKTDRLDEFASVVSHDLRNPLNTLELSLDLAAETGDREHFERCRRAIDRMERLTDDLLTLARYGESVADPEAIEVETLVVGCWRTVETGDASLSVETDRTIQADRGRAEQLFENLIDNAVEHGGDDVSITVGDLEDGTGLYLADDGPGIPVEDRDRVFENGYTTAEQGTGYGLAIVDDVAEAHGWDVAVTESVAGGARFEISGV